MAPIMIILKTQRIEVTPFKRRRSWELTVSFFLFFKILLNFFLERKLK